MAVIDRIYDGIRRRLLWKLLWPEDAVKYITARVIDWFFVVSLISWHYRSAKWCKDSNGGLACLACVFDPAGAHHGPHPNAKFNGLMFVVLISYAVQNERLCTCNEEANCPCQIRSQRLRLWPLKVATRLTRFKEAKAAMPTDHHITTQVQSPI